MPSQFEQSGKVECLTLDADVFGASRHSGLTAAREQMLPGRKFSLFLAEDDEDEAFLVEWAVRKTECFEFIGRAYNGEEVVRNLVTLSARAYGLERRRPDLLLLDLKMPRGDGFAVLEWLKTSHIDGLTVAVLTGSMRPEDMARALQLGAHFYERKTPNVADYIVMLRQFESFLERRRTG